MNNDDDETIVEISSGKLRGTTTKIKTTNSTTSTMTDGNENHNDVIMITSYVGIPFADPPVGDLRWRPPKYPLSKDNNSKKAWANNSKNGNNDDNKMNMNMNMNMIRDCTTNQYRKMNSAHQTNKPDDYLIFEAIRNGMGHSFMKRVLIYIILYFLLPYFLAPSESEDCLYLNVHVPKKKKKGKNNTDNDNDDSSLLPVMVWFHGGDHQFGSATNDPVVNKPHQLCRVGNVILVTVNYRLGLFGFFCHPDLTKESSKLDSNNDTPSGIPTCGNYGILDQIASLKWVRDNIKQFSGNPSNVTIFGESAGGESVMHLLTSPLSKGLFHRAIAQSPANAAQMLYRSKKTLWYPKSLEDSGIGFANHALRVVEEKKKGSNNIITTSTTNDIELLRKIPATQLMNLFRTADIAQQFSFYPVIDGVVLPYSPFECFRQGKQHANIPLMIGSNKDEGSILWPKTKVPVVWRAVDYQTNKMNKNNSDNNNNSITEKWIKEDFSDDNDAERLFKLYPGLKEGDSSAQTDCLGDSMFGSKAYYYAIHHAAKTTTTTPAAVAAAATANTYLYQFGQHPPSPNQTAGAYHAAELPYVFGDMNNLILPVDTSTNLSEVMSKYWTNFATTGSPNKNNNKNSKNNKNNKTDDDNDDSPTTIITSSNGSSSINNDMLPEWRACKVTVTANGHEDNGNDNDNDNDNDNEWMYFGDGIAKMTTLDDAKKEKYGIMTRKLDRQLDSLPGRKDN